MAEESGAFIAKGVVRQVDIPDGLVLTESSDDASNHCRCDQVLADVKFLNGCRSVVLDGVLNDQLHRGIGIVSVKFQTSQVLLLPNGLSQSDEDLVSGCLLLDSHLEESSQGQSSQATGVCLQKLNEVSEIISFNGEATKGEVIDSC